MLRGRAPRRVPSELPGADGQPAKHGRAHQQGRYTHGPILPEVEGQLARSNEKPELDEHRGQDDDVKE